MMNHSSIVALPMNVMRRNDGEERTNVGYKKLIIDNRQLRISDESDI